MDFEAPSICLLVAVINHEDQDKQLEPVFRWCVENGFELIKWTLTEDKSTRESKASGGSLLEDNETSGTARLAEALEAHIWPDITMKSSSIQQAPKLDTAPLNTTTDEKSTKMLSENEKLLAEGQDREKEDGDESFEELFARFAEMKSK